MNWKRCSLSISLGIAIGLLVQKQLDDKTLSAEKALSKVKQAVKQKHQIDGSWIHMTPEQIERHGLDYDVYKGGLTLTKNDQVKHYDFTADAETGSVLELSSNE
jgi:predicted small secreted protein